MSIALNPTIAPFLRAALSGALSYGNAHLIRIVNPAAVSSFHLKTAAVYGLVSGFLRQFHQQESACNERHSRQIEPCSQYRAGRWILDKAASVIAANHFGEGAMDVDRLAFLNLVGYVEEAFITGVLKRVINIEFHSDR